MCLFCRAMAARGTPLGDHGVVLAADAVAQRAECRTSLEDKRRREESDAADQGAHGLAGVADRDGDGFRVVEEAGLLGAGGDWGEGQENREQMEKHQMSNLPSGLPGQAISDLYA